MKHLTSQRRFAALAVGVVGLLALVFAAPSSAKRIYKSVPTYVTFSANRVADGTVTAKAIFTSPNPRCLSADRWKKLSDGYYHVTGAALYYRDLLDPNFISGTALPTNNGWLSPISPAGHSPYVWQVIWPGSLPVKVHVEGIHAGEAPHNYTSTVAAAAGMTVGGYAPQSPRYSYYKYTYNQGGNRIILKCGTTPNGSHKEFGKTPNGDFTF